MPQTDLIQSSGARSCAAGAILQSRYRILRPLGRGGMGAVYEAVDLRLGHSVAIKQTLTTEEQLWTHFEREARLMARLSHPTLPRVSDYFTEGNRAYLVMQFIDGPDLAEILARQPGPLPERVVIAWADQLLDALIYLHSHDRQVVHRDIKPHNLKVTESGRIVLLDFGLAKAQGENYEDDKDSGRSIFGFSPRYAPLEQIQDRGTTPQSDIYALGATLYHLLTGVKPPDALMRAAAVIASDPDPLRPAHEINSAVGIQLSAILSRALAQNPNHRYASAVEFREAIRRVGRTEMVNEVEIVPHRGSIDATVVQSGETTLLARTRIAAWSRLDALSTTAVFLLVLTAFSVFCRYYPWNLPADASQTPQTVAVARADQN